MTSRVTSKLPSAGFVAVVLTYALALAFFIWGFSTPDLDRIWTIHHELKIGLMDRLDGADSDILRRAMVRWPRLARSLLDERDIGVISSHSQGWIDTPAAVILRTPGARRHRSILLDIQTAEDLLPCQLVVRGRGWKREQKLSGHGLVEIALPEVPDHPEIISVALKGRDFPRDPSALGVRIRFPED